MPKPQSYLTAPVDDPVMAIVQGIDRDVARGEDILMLGFGIVMLSSTFAPVAPPTVILPLVALTFAVSAGCARCHYHRMERKLNAAVICLDRQDKIALQPITKAFSEHPMPPLVDSFNLLKNIKRTWRSVLGGILINPLWMPIFYVMGMQIVEERNLITLNQAIVTVEKNIL